MNLKFWDRSPIIESASGYRFRLSDYYMQEIDGSGFMDLRRRFAARSEVRSVLKELTDTPKDPARFHYMDYGNYKTVWAALFEECGDRAIRLGCQVFYGKDREAIERWANETVSC